MIYFAIFFTLFLISFVFFLRSKAVVVRYQDYRPFLRSSYAFGCASVIILLVVIFPNPASYAQTTKLLNESYRCPESKEYYLSLMTFDNIISSKDVGSIQSYMESLCEK